ncbi:MAG: hypothetical protein PHH41_11335 [Sulfurimonas sp.]|nr:hypothetical protein [Sulfurimonas sp.]MDD3060594.1 hypothetical protein [Sulfurimonas sp.]MDD5203717.1 hypothetical protein [Sulfurimonas sp.]
MNLELIQEIHTLIDEKKSYTEIAEFTGLARTSVVLSVRLSKIFNNSHSQQISSLNSDIELLTSTIKNYKNSFLEKELEIQTLNTFIDFDCDCKMLVEKDEFMALKNELEKSKNEVDILKRKLKYKSIYLSNLSFVGKMKILFNQGD